MNPDQTDEAHTTTDKLQGATRARVLKKKITRGIFFLLTEFLENLKGDQKQITTKGHACNTVQWMQMCAAHWASCPRRPGKPTLGLVWMDIPDPH